MIGEIAGIATSVFFASTAMIFTKTGRMIGSQVTNRVRILFALLYLLILNMILFQSPLPLSAGTSRWIWLGLSGIIGLSLGDAFLFRTYVAVGARLGSLLMSLAPIIGSIIAWIVFEEVLTAMQILGILIALGGTGWVVSSHKAETNLPQAHTREGVIFGTLGAIGQALGLILSKQAMAGGFPPFQANAIRMLAAFCFMGIWTIAERQISTTIETIRAQPKSLWLIALGAMLGPVLGVSSSLLSVQHIEIGVASTLMALPPVIVLPASYFVFKEPIGWQGIAGTVLAILGVAVLFLA